MKKILFATTAIAGLAMVATPALADGINMDLSGFYRGYGVFADNDETSTAAAGDEFREFNLRHDAEIHFTGETTLDNGLTVGVHAEVELADVGAFASDYQDEIYTYMSGSWGRVNLGKEDGSAYLLQIAAPSADSNVDGLRTYFQALDTTNLAAVTIAGQDMTIDYATDFAENDQKITYLTPKFSGFQAGVSWTPEVTDSNDGVGNGIAVPATNDDLGDFEDGLEIAARWDGEFENVALSFGAGYLTADTEADAATGTQGSDDLDAWNVGANLGFAGVTLGGAYTETNNGIDVDGDTTTFVVGLGWANGPYTVGASYLDREYEVGTGVTETDVDRITVGGTYTYGPGMSFRGAVAFGEVDATGTANDRDFTQVTVGTEINF